MSQMNQKFFTYNPVQPTDYLHVIIEAPNCIEANEIAKSKAGAYFEGFSDCACCSDRWTAHYTDEDSTEVPSIYGRPLTEYVIERPCDMSKEPGVIVYFLGGEKEYKWAMDGKFCRLEEVTNEKDST